MLGKLKIVASSDFHGNLPEITEPADIMVIAGDIIPLDFQFNKEKSQTWFETEFAYWIKQLPVDKVFMVAGNHDSYLESCSKTKLQMIMKATDNKLVYLENKTVDYFDENGLKWTIFGTPYCHIYGNWPFMRSEKYMEEKFKLIPDKVDIIISHDPPFAAGDVDVILEAPQHRQNRLFEHLGNIPLKIRLSEIEYKIVFCGHIHGGDHTLSDLSFWKSVNVSYMDEFYQPTYKPFYTEITHD